MSKEAVDDFLAHYGVKGMKWGVRKDRKLDRNNLPSNPFSAGQVINGQTLTKANVRRHDEALKAIRDGADVSPSAEKSLTVGPPKLLAYAGKTKRVITGDDINYRYKTPGYDPLAGKASDFDSEATFRRNGLRKLGLRHSDSSDVDEFLAHYGVKGMKWGVRKDKGHEGERAKTTKIEKLDRKFERDTKSFDTTIKIYNSAAKRSNEVDVPRINKKYEGQDFSKDSPMRRKYYAEHQKAMLDNLQRAADEMGTNASGTKKYSIVETDNGGWDIYLDEVKHADRLPEMSIELVKDSNGFITELKPVLPEDLEHAEELEDFLVHYGIKGMKWGVRRRRGADGLVDKSEDATRARDLQKKAKKSGTDSLSNKELQDLVTRMNLEKQYSNLNPKTKSAGRKFVEQTARNLAQQEIQAAIQGKEGPATKAVKLAIEAAKKR